MESQLEKEVELEEQNRKDKKSIRKIIYTTITGGLIVGGIGYILASNAENNIKDLLVKNPSYDNYLQICERLNEVNMLKEHYSYRKGTYTELDIQTENILSDIREKETGLIRQRDSLENISGFRDYKKKYRGNEDRQTLGIIITSPGFLAAVATGLSTIDDLF